MASQFTIFWNLRSLFTMMIAILTDFFSQLLNQLDVQTVSILIVRLLMYLITFLLISSGLFCCEANRPNVEAPPGLVRSFLLILHAINDGVMLRFLLLYRFLTWSCDPTEGSEDVVVVPSRPLKPVPLNAQPRKALSTRIKDVDGYSRLRIHEDLNEWRTYVVGSSLTQEVPCYRELRTCTGQRGTPSILRVRKSTHDALPKHDEARLQQGERMAAILDRADPRFLELADQAFWDNVEYDKVHAVFSTLVTFRALKEDDCFDSYDPNTTEEVGPMGEGPVEEGPMEKGSLCRSAQARPSPLPLPPSLKIGSKKKESTKKVTLQTLRRSARLARYHNPLPPPAAPSSPPSHAVPCGHSSAPRRSTRLANKPRVNYRI
jgi:hypothetical protein